MKKSDAEAISENFNEICAIFNVPPQMVAGLSQTRKLTRWQKFLGWFNDLIAIGAQPGPERISPLDLRAQFLRPAQPCAYCLLLLEHIEGAAFWSNFVYPQGASAQQIQDELVDYHSFLGNVAKVYMHITGGKISKQNTLAEDVIAVADEYTDELIDQSVADALEQYEAKRKRKTRRAKRGKRK
jgi:hypothetical protein